MELDTFTMDLGTKQGRVGRPGSEQDAEHVVVLGHLDRLRRANLAIGDYVELAQDVDLTTATLLRVRGSLHARPGLPAGSCWELALMIGEQGRAALRVRAGETKQLNDLAAYVGDQRGAQRVAVRLQLVSDSA